MDGLSTLFYCLQSFTLHLYLPLFTGWDEATPPWWHSAILFTCMCEDFFERFWCHRLFIIITDILVASLNDSVVSPSLMSLCHRLLHIFGRPLLMNRLTWTSSGFKVFRDTGHKCSSLVDGGTIMTLELGDWLSGVREDRHCHRVLHLGVIVIDTCILF